MKMYFTLIWIFFRLENLSYSVSFSSLNHNKQIIGVNIVRKIAMQLKQGDSRNIIFAQNLHTIG